MKKWIKKFLVMQLLVFLSCWTVSAQVITVSGTITLQNGEPLPGASVVVKGTSTGTIADADGNFSLNIPEGTETLVISFIGMKTKEVPVTSSRTYTITLEEDVYILEEVVAIGYGTMKKSDLTGSVASVQGDEIAVRSPIRVSQSLQGITPGLMVTRSGASAADASASIRIRGITTIGDSNPLVIIDGVPGTLDWVNPNDIENISVLKDAASASIYGSRAAAGVILVTTKKSKAGQLRMSYDFHYTIEEPTRTASYADAVDYMKVHNELSWNDNNNIQGGEYPIYSKDLVDNYRQLNADDPYNYPDTDWHDLMVKKSALQKKHMLSLTGGTEYVSSYISLNMENTDGLFMGKRYDRITLRANNDIKINQYFSAEVNLNGLYSVNTTSQSSQSGQAIVPGPIGAPVFPAEWPDGRIAPGKGGENPYAVLKHAGSVDTKANVMGGKAQINFTPIHSLRFSAAYYAELYDSKTKSFRKQLTYTSYEDPLTSLGLIRNAETTKLTESRNDMLTTNFQILSNYSERFANHNIALMAGFEENYTFSESLGAWRDQFALKNFPYLNIGNENYQFNSGSAYEYANRSFFGRVIYDYNDKYLLQSNVRYDGSSRFHEDYRWGVFPSVSLGWVISEENFMKDIDILDFLKIRASWGALGNERIGNYPYQSTVGFGSTILFQESNVNAAQTAGLTAYTIPDISWEKTETYNIGADINILENRLRLIADYYKKTTKDMLLALEIPDFIGLSNPQQNTGEMYTKGWEISIGWTDKKGDFSYSVNGHLSDFKSIMGDLGGTEFLGSQVKFEGSEFNEWYGYVSEGIYQTPEEVANSAKLYANVKPGDVKYKDISGPDGEPDGKISSEYDRVLLGGSLPRFLYGGNIDLGYKNFSCNLVFQGIGKQNSLISQEAVRPLHNYWEDVQKLIIGKYWSHYNTDEQNQKAIYPRLTETNRSNNYASSDFWLFNGAYFRLKNINLGYNLPNTLVSRLKLNSIRLNVNISDVFSIDNYPEGWDPETTSTYWITRGYTMGISVKF